MDSMFPYEMLEEMGSAVTTGQMIYNVSVNILNIVGYVLLALSLYTIAKRRGISNPWLAWIPVVQIWVLGSISDQFRYVTKAQVKNKRTTLLVMCIIYTLVIIAVVAFILISAFQFFEMSMYAGEETLAMEGLSMVFKVLGTMLLAAGFALAYMIIYYIALYDVFMSVNPNNAVLFLVLSIIFGVAMPFFLFFNRKKDSGMPPRCDVPQAPVNYVPEVPVQETEPAMIEAPAEEEAPVEEAPAEEAEVPAEETESPAEETPVEETEVPAEEPEEQTEE